VRLCEVARCSFLLPRNLIKSCICYANVGLYVTSCSYAEMYVHYATAVEQEDILKNAVETKKKSAARVADVEDKLKNSKAVRERELKQAQKEVDDAKKRYNQSIAKTKEKEQVRCMLCTCECDLASAVNSHRRHCVFKLLTHACVYLCVIKVCRHKYRWWEFHRICNSGTFGDEDALVRFEVKLTARTHMADKHFQKHFLACFQKSWTEINAAYHNCSLPGPHDAGHRSQSEIFSGGGILISELPSEAI